MCPEINTVDFPLTDTSIRWTALENGFLELVPMSQTSHKDGHLVHVPKLSTLFDGV